MKHRAAIILAVTMMIAAVLIMTVDFSGREVAYDIEYSLDGGTNGDNPTTYTRSDEFLFEPAVREGHDFSGWFSDPTFRNEMPGISKGTKGDLKVYAAWTEDLVGTGVVLDLSGVYNDGAGTVMTGTYVFSFLAKEGNEYFQELRTDVKYGASGFADDTFYWSKDEAKLWTSHGKETLKTRDGYILCDVLTFGDKTR